MPGLRQLNQRAASAVLVIEPEIFAEDLLIPVGALGSDHDGIAVGRNLKCGKADGVEKIVEGELGFVLGFNNESTTREDQNNRGSL